MLLSAVDCSSVSKNVIIVLTCYSGIKKDWPRGVVGVAMGRAVPGGTFRGAAKLHFWSRRDGAYIKVFKGMEIFRLMGKIF